MDPYKLVLFVLVTITLTLTVVTVVMFMLTIIEHYTNIILPFPPQWWVKWRYPYGVWTGIDVAVNPKVDAWCAENGIPQQQIGFEYRFKTERDAVLFKMRWL